MKVWLTVLWLALAVSTVAHAQSGWSVSGALGSSDFVLNSPTIADQGISYRFRCGSYAMSITEVGVTGIANPTSDRPAKLALMTNKGNSALWPAASRPNPGSGWDLTITLPKKSKTIKTLGQASYISLLTEGYNPRLPLTDEDRVVLGDFVDRCLRG